MDQLTLIQRIAVWVLPVMFAITVHEVAHGWIANRLGDSTASRLGRLTLNPLKHIDPIGTILVPGILLYLGGFIFGWAKPVPVDGRNLRSPKTDMAWVALAGPGANFFMALGWTSILGIARWLDLDTISEPLMYMGSAGIFINLIMMVVNLLPIPPLDGGRIMVGILPRHWAEQYSRLEPFGLFIMIGLISTGLLNALLGQPVFVLQKWLFSLAGF